jgi:hypothetical protein
MPDRATVASGTTYVRSYAPLPSKVERDLAPVRAHLGAGVVHRIVAEVAERFGPEVLAAEARRIAEKFPDVPAAEVFRRAEGVVEYRRMAAEGRAHFEAEVALTRREFQRAQAERDREKQALKAEIQSTRTALRHVTTRIARLACVHPAQGRSESRPRHRRVDATSRSDSGDPSPSADPDLGPPRWVSRRGGAR